MRVSVDLERLKRAVLAGGCPHCKGVTPQVDSKKNSLIWYCAQCDVYHETTPRGVPLRSFRREADQIINLPPQGG